MQKPILLVDMDEVCADMLGALCDTLNGAHGLALTRETFTDWDMRRFVPAEVNPADVFDIPGFFRHLAPVPGARDALEILSQIYEIVICTNAPPLAYADKQAWVAEHLPFVQQGNFIATPRKDLIQAHARVDDYPPNLRGGGLGILFDAPHNRAHQLGAGQFRANDWPHALRLLLGYWYMCRPGGTVLV